MVQQQKKKVLVDVSALKTFVDTDGVIRAKLKEDGAYPVEFTAVRLFVDESDGVDKGANKIALVLTVAAPDPEEGATLTATRILDGMTRGNPPEAKIWYVGKALRSVGYSTEEVQKILGDGTQDLEAKLPPLLQGKKGWVYARAEAYEGRINSNIDSFLTPERLEKLKKSNQLRTSYNEQKLFEKDAKKNGGSAGGPSTSAAGGNGAGDAPITDQDIDGLLGTGGGASVQAQN